MLGAEFVEHLATKADRNLQCEVLQCEVLDTLSRGGIVVTMPATRSSSGLMSGLYRALSSLQLPGRAP